MVGEKIFFYFTTSYMKYLPTVFILFVLSGVNTTSAQTGKEEKDVLRVVQNFFDALEKQDTAAFRQMFLKDAHNFSIRESKDTMIVRSQRSTSFKFDPRRIIKERMRSASTQVQIHKGIAMVWAPYDLWVDEKFSHCGVDVFTLVKSNAGWKIASIAYTMETEDCE